MLSTRIVHAHGIGMRVMCGLGLVMDLPTDHEAVGISRFDEDDPEACEQCKRELKERDERIHHEWSRER